jgi:NO-binding membrane sensor protein with MHYT domain
VAASFVALATISRRAVTAPLLLCGGLLVGLGIGAMHYTACMPCASACCATTRCCSCCRRGGRGAGHAGPVDTLRPARLAPPGAVAAPADQRLVMGCAIAGMHYMGMQAARFVGTIPPG